MDSMGISEHFYERAAEAPSAGAALPDSERQECYMLLVGKEASSDGSVLLGHNNDLEGNEASMIEKIPGKKHALGDVVAFLSGLTIPQAKETCEWMVLRIYSGFGTGDAVGINEYGVAIAGGVALGEDRSLKSAEADPLVKKGLSGAVRYHALERSKTARECVELLGRLYTRYGVTYPSGVAVADGNEIWYIEAGGGHQWAAVRVPDDKYLVVANAYRIGEIDVKDGTNCLAAPDLLDFVKEKGLWDPAKGPFSFRKAFGGGRISENPRYDSRRVWRGLSLLSPGASLDPDARDQPFFMEPDEKITLEKMKGVLRDTYAGTPYDIYSPGEKLTPERAIAAPQCVHSDVLQLRGRLPADIGSVLWGALGCPMTTAYVPYYFGIHTISSACSTAGPSYDPESAFWINRSLQQLVLPQYNRLIGEVLPVFERFEAEAMACQLAVEKAALELFETDEVLGRSFLTSYSNGLSLTALEKTKNLIGLVKTRLAQNSRGWNTGK